MLKYATMVKATPGQKISGYDFGYSQPEYFREWVNGNWQDARPGAVLECEPLPRTAEIWQELGEFLTRELIAMGESIGVYIDCNQPLPPLQSWLRAAAVTLGDEVNPEWGMGLGCGYVVQASDKAEWATTIWRDVESDWLDYGIGLMVVSFDSRVQEGLQFSEESGWPVINAFGNLLKQAAAWLVPWDCNIGFQLGLPVRSDLYRRLMPTDSTDTGG